MHISILTLPSVGGDNRDVVIVIIQYTTVVISGATTIRGDIQLETLYVIIVVIDWLMQFWQRMYHIITFVPGLWHKDWYVY